MDIRFDDSAATGSDQRRILIRDHGREPERDEFSSGGLIACADTPPDLILRRREAPSRRMGHGRHSGLMVRDAEGTLLTMRGDTSLVDQTAVERRQELVVEDVGGLRPLLKLEI